MWELTLQRCDWTCISSDVMCDVAFGAPYIQQCFLRSSHWLQCLQYFPFKSFTCQAYYLIYSVCIARDVLAIRITTTFAQIGIISFHFCSQKHLMWQASCICSSADRKQVLFVNQSHLLRRALLPRQAVFLPGGLGAVLLLLCGLHYSASSHWKEKIIAGHTHHDHW